MIKVRVLILSMAMLLVGSTVHAEEISGSAEAGAAVMSSYVWRGITVNDALVIQPTVGMSYGAFNANFWSNIQSDIEAGNKDDMIETDLTINYTRSIDKLGIDVGYIYYAVVGANSQEIYAGLSYDTLLSPSLTLYYDIEDGNGGFAVAAIGHSLPLGDMSVDLGALISLNLENEIMGLDADGEAFTGLYNGELSVSTSYPVGPVSISPMIAYSLALGDDAETAIEALSADGESSVFYGGISISTGF